MKTNSLNKRAANHRQPPARQKGKTAATLSHCSFSNSFLRREGSGQMNCLSDPLISSTATKIPTHSFSNLDVSWSRVLSEQASRRHNLSRLTVTALRDLNLHPGALNRMTEVSRETFNRRYSLSLYPGNWCDA